MLIGIIVFSVFAGIHSSATYGLHLSVDFMGGMDNGHLVPAFQARKLVTDSLIAMGIAMALIIIYTLIRFK